MIKKICDLIAGNVAILVLAFALTALLKPSMFSFIHTSAINWMLGIIMFGMGLTLKPQDFKRVFAHPRNIFTGCLAQFTIMPGVAYLLCKSFQLPTEIAIGIILVGCCPGGTASNVITYIAKGDLALSVGMTIVSTILAPLLTPLLTYLLAGESVDVDIISMFISIMQVVILPIIIGALLDHYFRHYTEKVVPYLPMVSTITIALIVACIVGANSTRIMSCGLLIISVVVLHNCFGLTLGYIVGKLLHLQQPQRSAISIEVGMQNSGLATSLAATHFAQYPLAVVPGAIFSVWHNFSGAIIANIYRKLARKDEQKSENKAFTE